MGMHKLFLSSRFPAHMFLSVLIIILSVTGITFNVLVCIVMKRSKRLMKVVSNFFILHLSVVEVAFLLYLMINTIYFLSTGNDMQEAVCITIHSISDVLAGAIFCLLAGIALDRFANIAYPFQGRIIMAKWRLKGSLIVWTYALLTGFLTKPFSVEKMKIGRDRKIRNITENYFRYFCDARQTTMSLVLITLNFILRFVVPLVVIASCYIKILVVLRKRRRECSFRERKTSYLSSSSKAMKVLFFVVLSYFLWLFPTGVYPLLAGFGLIDDFNTKIKFKMVSNIMMRVSSILIPFIYAFYNPKFRREFFRVLRMRKTANSLSRAENLSTSTSTTPLKKLSIQTSTSIQSMFLQAQGIELHKITLY